MATLHGDIISDHRERMLNLKKYYPFFRLTETDFSQFKGGKYDILDMGYIVMAILRFFIEENNFKEKDVTYPEYLDFIRGVLTKDFGLSLNEEESKEIGDYIFDKIKNDGKPFDFQYFDPIDRKKRVSRVRMIESTVRNSTVWYSISPDAIEFYLDTKEIRDESRINVQQLLLEKMIRANNFKGGTEVVERINEEVNRLQHRKNEVLALISSDVYAGIEAYEDFVNTGMKWFEDEEKLFRKNRDLIAAALEKIEEKGHNETYFKIAGEIHELESQLKVAMNKHGELLRACTDMQKLTDEAIMKAKLGKIRSHVEFAGMLQEMIKTDRADILSQMLAPLFKPNIKKTFDLVTIDSALSIKPPRYSEAEKVTRETPEEIVYDDEIEEARIRDNYIFIMDNLYMALKERAEFTLGEFNAMMEKHYSADVLKNADYFSFFVNLCQKTHYTIGGMPENESFLDAYVSEAFEGAEKVEFEIEQGEGSVDDGSAGEYEAERQDGDEAEKIEFRNVVFRRINTEISN
jgi:hypothetical protein